MKYRHILSTIGDVEKDAGNIAMAKQLYCYHHYAKITFLHAVKQLSRFALSYSLPSFIDIEQNEVKQAAKRLDETCSTVGLDEYDTAVAIGSPSDVIVDHAKQVGADLIIVGRHQNAAKAAVATALLKKTTCDVLVVQDGK